MDFTVVSNQIITLKEAIEEAVNKNVKFEEEVYVGEPE